MADERTDYRGALKPIWCPGCGDFAVLNALLRALGKKQIPPSDLVFVAGIGCASRLPGFVKCNRLHTIHGRILPVAMGVKLSNPRLRVFGVGGDGDGLAIGGNHFIHAAKRNPELVYIMMDNSVYGMTKGQPSQTSPLDIRTKASPYGTVERPFDPCALAIACGASFVARGFSGRPRELEEVLERAMDHRGFAFVHVLSPCITFRNTFALYRELVKDMKDHDATDRSAAFGLAVRSEGFPLGVYLETKDETLDERVLSFIPKTPEKDLKELLRRFE